MIAIKRAYEKASSSDGSRYLVDRLWPRGVSKDALKLTGWMRDVAPSDKLRRWYKHDPKKWTEFKRRYFAELDANPDAWKPLARAARGRRITLIFSSRETNLNNAVALQKYLQARLNLE